MGALRESGTNWRYRRLRNEFSSLLILLHFCFLSRKTKEVPRAKKPLRPTLFDEKGVLHSPARENIGGTIEGNLFSGYAQLADTQPATFSEYHYREAKGYVASLADGRRVFLTNKKIKKVPEADATLLMSGASSFEDYSDPAQQLRGEWTYPETLVASKVSLDKCEQTCRAIVASWKGAFQFREENRDLKQAGLRRPQIGALYATLAHWSTASTPATIVMPTGTGKTDTMLALLVCAQIKRLLVVVPSNTLRDQIFEKFRTLGKLFEAQCVTTATQLPVVVKLRHGPTSPEHVETIFRRANVVVSTMKAVSQCSELIQATIANECSHLFIDEAHHIAARTWTNFKRAFEANQRPILQFTATPFRTDGKRIDGRFIYSYPLSRAQQEGYFRPVKLLSVEEYDRDDADRSIAQRSVSQLRHDLSLKLDHLLMARVDDTKRADALYKLYAREFPEFSPVVIHSKVTSSERRDRLSRIIERKSRILICVDMFGEGFDLPQLKIAALHDKHQSLAITLQFVGRFTRDYPTNVGDAHVVANIADETTSDALRNLYAEDADWVFLLQMFSEASTGKSQSRNEMLQGFTGSLVEIPLQTLFPKMSAVAYHTKYDQWKPLKVVDVVPGARLHAGPVVNPSERVAVFITRDEEFVRWGEVKQIQNVEWNLHILYWNEDQSLLFINSSSKDFHENIAEAVGGSRERIVGRTTFRALGGIRRLLLNNLGLSHALGKNIRYTMFMGADIAEGLSQITLTNRKMSNVFGLGYEDDERVTIGCSAKGRLWSHKIAYDLSEWVRWCNHVGAKLLDSQISIDSLLSNLIKARRVSARPSLVPVMILWPEDFQHQPEDRVEIEIGTTKSALHECAIDLLNHSEAGPLTFEVSFNDQKAGFSFEFSAERVEFKQVSGDPAYAKLRNKRKLLTEWFSDDPPIVHFVNGDFLVFNELFELPRGDQRLSFDPNKIETWDWSGVDLTVESQGGEKNPASIQHRVIERLLADKQNFDVVFDGDGKGEVADVVAIKSAGSKISVCLFHLKYSGREVPGARIGDFYEVCGQAQKGIVWRESPRRMLKHLLHQEDARLKFGKPSRFERGTRTQIQKMINTARQVSFEYRVFIVQPGFKKASLAPAFLDVLGATEALLKETYSIPLRVITSK